MQTSAIIEQQRPPADGQLPIPMQLHPDQGTPVYGTAEPASGLPAQIRFQAYGYPAHDPRRWMLLLAADRTESGRSLAQEAVHPGGQEVVVRHVVRQVRDHPRGTATIAAIVTGCMLARSLMRRLHGA